MSARAHGFTLIEMLAVSAIAALLAAVALPNLGLRASRAAADQAADIASTLEYARQQALVERVPHRVVLDLDAASYWTEREAPAPAAEAAAQDGPWAQLEQLPLVAPRAARGEFTPLPPPAGEPTPVREQVRIEEVERGGERVVEGRTWIQFGADGSAERSAIHLRDADGRLLRLDVAPLEEGIRIEHEGE